LAQDQTIAQRRQQVPNTDSITWRHFCFRRALPTCCGSDPTTALLAFEATACKSHSAIAL